MGKSDIKKILHLAINNKGILFLLVIFVIMLMPGIVKGQIIANWTDVSCYNTATENDGAIKVNVTSPASGNFSYSINTVPVTGPILTTETSYTFINLPPGTYTVTVTENASTPNSVTIEDIDIAQPTQFTGIDVFGWYCNPSSGCKSSLSITMNGGSPDYTIEITGAVTHTQTTSNNTYSLDPNSVCSGTYNISVKDRCITVPFTQSITLNLDDVVPTCTTEPSKIDITNFTHPVEQTTFFPTAPPYNHTFTFDAAPNVPIQETITISGSKNYANLELQIYATQSPGQWETGDYLMVEVSKNGGTNYTTLLKDYCAWSATHEETEPSSQCDVPSPTSIENATWIELGNAESTNDIIIRLTAFKTDGGTYKIDQLNIRGYNIRGNITSTGPSICNDVILGREFPIVPVPIDGPITWQCSDLTNEEFSFTRTWSVTDICNNVTTYPQLISVSSSPTPYPNITFQPLSNTYDFCQSKNKIISHPEILSFSDNCITDPAEFTYEWKMYDYNNNDLTTDGWHLNGSTYSFTPEDLDRIYTVAWRITDKAGFTTIIDQYSSTHKITIRANITAKITADLDDVCQNDGVTFNIQASGGSGTYDTYTFTPNTGIWDRNNYTISWGSSGPTVLTFTITDSEGCKSVVLESDNFTVHPKITTGTITRTP